MVLDTADSQNDSEEPEEAVADDVNPKLHEPVLKNLDELKVILEARPFNLDWLVAAAEKVLRECHSALQTPCGTDLGASRAGHLHYQATTAESGAPMHPQSRQADLNSLQRGRDALNNDHGNDPLEESREIAEECTGISRRTNPAQPIESLEMPSPKSPNNNDPPTSDVDATDDEPSPKKSPKRGKRFYDKQKLKSPLSFGDSEDEDEENEKSPKRAKLSKVSPSRRLSISVLTQHKARPAKGFLTKANVPPPDQGRFDQHGMAIKKVPWSDEETNCIIEALRQNPNYKGNWAEIKKLYGHELRNRTTVQIKDKFKNLTRAKDSPLDFLNDPMSEHGQDEENAEDIEEHAEELEDVSTTALNAAWEKEDLESPPVQV